MEEDGQIQTIETEASLIFDSRSQDRLYDYESLPEGGQRLADFLRSEIYNLSDINPSDLRFLMSEYFRPWGNRSAHILPVVSQGYVRLFRGERLYDESYVETHDVPHGAGRWWSAFLDQAALYSGNRTEDRGTIHYVDVPEYIAQKAHVLRLPPEQLDRVSVHPEEFYLPKSFADSRFSLTRDQIEILLREGLYTKDGVNIDFDALSEDEHFFTTIRWRLQYLAFEAIAEFWLNQDFKEKRSEPPNHTPVLNTIENTENLLARICGWR